MKYVYPHHKTIARIDFEFDLFEKAGQYLYLVKAEHIEFKMNINDDGKWRIQNIVPVWIQGLEDLLDGEVVIIDFNQDSRELIA